MISIETALSLVKETVDQLSAKTRICPLSDAIGLTLAEPVYSPISQPPFRQSSMDGYALGSIDISEFKVIGEVPAGQVFTGSLNPQEAVRIFTGAAVPDSAQAVIMQEWTDRTGNQLLLKQTVALGANIRPEGEQMEEGDLAMPVGHTITPATVGYLSGLGITEVSVHTPPRIAVVITGDELVKPGNPLQKGQVYEGNSEMLKSACQQVSPRLSLIHI